MSVPQDSPVQCWGFSVCGASQPLLRQLLHGAQWLCVLLSSCPWSEDGGRSALGETSIPPRPPSRTPAGGVSLHGLKRVFSLRDRGPLAGTCAVVHSLPLEPGLFLRFFVASPGLDCHSPLSSGSSFFCRLHHQRLLISTAWRLSVLPHTQRWEFLKRLSFWSTCSFTKN